MTEVLVMSPSFGQWSEIPGRLLNAAGVDVREPSCPSPLSSEDATQEIGEVDAIIVGLDQVDETVIDAAKNLKVIAKHGVGVDNIDVKAASLRGIKVVNVPGANSEAVADLVLGLMLNLLRQINAADQDLKAGNWSNFAGPELSELTVGILGYGRIGRGVKKRVEAFGAKIAAFDPYAPEEAFKGVQRVHTQDELLEVFDLVTLHLPGGSDNPLIGARELKLIGSQGYLINAARGELVDEQAVADALHAGELRGYAADAFMEEPPRNSPLIAAPRTILTPHIGAFTSATNERMGVSVVEDILAVLIGREPKFEVK